MQSSVRVRQISKSPAGEEYQRANVALMHRLKRELVPEQLASFKALSSRYRRRELDARAYCNAAASAGVSVDLLRAACLPLRDDALRQAALRVLASMDGSGKASDGGRMLRTFAIATSKLTALAVVPPEGSPLWEAAQSLRRRHDRHVDRWPAHSSLDIPSSSLLCLPRLPFTCSRFVPLVRPSPQAAAHKPYLSVCRRARLRGGGAATAARALLLHRPTPQQRRAERRRAGGMGWCTD